MKLVQIGMAVMRDEATGKPLKPVIPIYAKTRQGQQESGFVKSEEKLLTDVAGLYVNIFRKYEQELKKIKQEAL